MKEHDGRTANLRWLNNKNWSEVTREERYFCAELYFAIKHDTGRFVCFLRKRYGTAIAPHSAWQVGFEVCFYRDWMHMNGNLDPDISSKLSLSRTFDLALFSNSRFLIIEAKAHQGFTGADLANIRKDRKQVQYCTGVPEVHTAAIISSRYSPRTSTVANFSLTPPICWKQLAEVYGEKAEIFLRADSIYND